MNSATPFFSASASLSAYLSFHLFLSLCHNYCLPFYLSLLYLCYSVSLPLCIYASLSSSLSLFSLFRSINQSINQLINQSINQSLPPSLSFSLLLLSLPLLLSLCLCLSAHLSSTSVCAFIYDPIPVSFSLSLFSSVSLPHSMFYSLSPTSLPLSHFVSEAVAVKNISLGGRVTKSDYGTSTERTFRLETNLANNCHQRFLIENLNGMICAQTTVGRTGRKIR